MKLRNILNEIKIQNPNSREAILIRFLKQNNAYEAFIENIINPRQFNSVKELLNNITLSLEELLQASFIWSDSNQGEKYWKELNLKWKEYLKHLKLNEIKVVNPSKITIYVREDNNPGRIRIGEFQDFRFPLIIEEKNIKIFYQLGNFSKTKKLTSIEQDARDFISFLIRKRKLNYHQDSGIGGSIYMVFNIDDFNIIYK